MSIPMGLTRWERHDFKVEKARSMRAAPTPPEAALWKVIGNGQVGNRVVRQQILMGWIADFYVPSLKAVIEVDGKQHAESQNRKKDAERDWAMLVSGYSVLRLSARTVLRSPRLARWMVVDFLGDVEDARALYVGSTTIRAEESSGFLMTRKEARHFYFSNGYPESHLDTECHDECPDDVEADA